MRIIGLGFANLFSVIASNYRSLRESDRLIINSYVAIILIVSIALIYIGIQSRDSENWLYVITGLLFSILVAVVFVIFDRLGVVTPIASRIDKSNQLLESLIDQLQGYEKYRHARFSFGFNAIVGISGKKPESAPDISFEVRDFALAIFNDAKDGDEISYMNSFILNDISYYNAISQAVMRGANIRVLLMKPDANAPVVIARYTDYYEEANKYTSPSDFVADIMPRYRYLDRLRGEMEKRRETHPSTGKFEIRYYTKSLNFPMITVAKPKGMGIVVPEVAYTGFYAGLNAEQMPYIEWRGGDFEIIKKLDAVFKAKWKACRDSNYVFLENKTTVNP